MARYSVFTDLDGTLIDHDTYRWDAARDAIGKLKKEGMPMIPCTSKTRAEIEVYMGDIGLDGPFISENGGGIFIPKGYFDFKYGFTKVLDGYNVIESGSSYALLRKALDGIRANVGGRLTGFGDMDAKEVAKDTGLTLREARLAKKREYDEAFRFEGDEKALERGIEKAGLKWTKGGRYWHIMGDNDKGKAVKILAGLFKEKMGTMKTVGLGDSLNDLPMLKAVDIAILVQKKDGTYDPRVKLDGIIKAKGVGPVGWNSAIEELLKD